MAEDITAQILRRLDYHSERLGKHDKAMDNIEAIARRIEVIDHKVNGNGSLGLDEQVRTNRRDIDSVRNDVTVIKKFTETLQPMVLFYKVGVWFASAIGLSIIALIWGLLTGSVELMFK